MTTPHQASQAIAPTEAVRTNRISIELVPRSMVALRADLATVAADTTIDTVNVPDLKKLPIRSWTAAAALEHHFTHRIPHLRSRDFHDRNIEQLVDQLQQARLDEVLVVAGDPAPNASVCTTYGYTPEAMLRQLRARAPRLQLYAALDPYRDARQEAQAIRRKLIAGATGFFTQPLFEVHDAATWRRRVPPGIPIFWGASPVLSERSRQWWERTNAAQFPDHFQPTLAWNADCARALRQETAAFGDHMYLMPIKTDLKKYLAAVM